MVLRKWVVEVSEGYLAEAKASQDEKVDIRSLQAYINELVTPEFRNFMRGIVFYFGKRTWCCFDERRRVVHGSPTIVLTMNTVLCSPALSSSCLPL